ncbi:SDR family NAD(P)-dependent oxidoreductase [Bradyrhizobium sp. WYCCWR 13023]|uniref:SDR family NAD(P)-dependent oxidoreductase n=1 Tax=Bradyrhizobium zhengyangense TaxID=2911009 RepID=A0A9X1UC10_9BRAD|nr:SDR family NAD(P)-dependent oxidoreductase [Bradyrhizobium zhengyangense]MCG2631801.1 SDR family NAD(P)-dependent oxidoreductase [Bradyrhizobium zhengyangense]
MASSPRSKTRDRYGPWALVTGASDGIGREFARRIAKTGINVALVARREDELHLLAENLHADMGVRTLVIACDLSRSDAVEKILSQTQPLDVGLVVAAAGYGSSGAFLGSDPAEELGMIDVNCRSVVELTRGMAPRLARRGRGGLILMSSLLAFQGVPRSANYAATKAFVQTFAEGIASELKTAGIDVVACAPGPIASGFARRADMRMSLSQGPEAVAGETLRKLGRRLTVRPGLLSKFLEWSLAPLPRRGRTRIMGIIMAGMTKHRNDTAFDQNTQPA